MTDRVIAEIRAALDETERVAQAAFDHPEVYNATTGEYERVGDDDGVWRADRCNVESPNVKGGAGAGIYIYDEGGHTEEQAEHIALHDPERELRMVAAGRKILDLHAPGVALTALTDGATVTSCMSCGGWHTLKTGTAWPCDTIKALAEAYGVEA